MEDPAGLLQGGARLTEPRSSLTWPQPSWVVTVMLPLRNLGLFPILHDFQKGIKWHGEFPTRRMACGVSHLNSGLTTRNVLTCLALAWDKLGTFGLEEVILFWPLNKFPLSDPSCGDPPFSTILGATQDHALVSKSSINYTLQSWTCLPLS